MFAAIDEEGRDVVLDILAGEYERVQAARRPVLRVIQGGPPTASRPTRPHGQVVVGAEEA
jgi:hypothetical protein